MVVTILSAETKTLKTLIRWRGIDSEKLLLSGLDAYSMQVTEKRIIKDSFIFYHLFLCIFILVLMLSVIKTKEMNIVIQSANFRAGFALENFVKEKLNKLFKQSRNIENINFLGFTKTLTRLLYQQHHK